MTQAAIFIAVAVKAVTDALKKPLLEWKPGMNFWWFYYVAFGIGAVLGWLSGLNVMQEFPEVTAGVGRLITALAIGGGPTLLHDLFDATITRIKG